MSDRFVDLMSSVEAWRASSGDSPNASIWAQRNHPLWADFWLSRHVFSSQDLEVYEVEIPAKQNHRTGGHLFYKSIREFYPLLSLDAAVKAVRVFVCFSSPGPEEIDLLLVLDSPPVRHWTIFVAVLSGDDRLCPLHVEFRGQSVDLETATRLIQSSLDWLSGVQVDPPVPAPALAWEHLLERAREGHQDDSLVDRLMDASSSDFLESIDRLYPWMYHGHCAHINEDVRIVERIEFLQSQIPVLAERGSLRSSPWKTGLGEPRWLSLPVLVSMGWALKIDRYADNRLVVSSESP